MAGDPAFAPRTGFGIRIFYGPALQLSTVADGSGLALEGQQWIEASNPKVAVSGGGLSDVFGAGGKD